MLSNLSIIRAYSRIASWGRTLTAHRFSSRAVTSGPDLGAAEQLADALLGVHLADQGAQAFARALHGQRGGERRLPDASLASHHEETLVGEFFDHG